MDTPLKKEDYVEPDCVVCGKPYGQEDIVRVPLGRIMEKLDEDMGRQDFAGAERHLTYWLSEAELNRDLAGQFSIHNEMMGFYRKMRRKDEAFRHAEAALALIDPLGLEGSPSAGTCYVNSGTVFAAFDEPERSVPYFEKARSIYEEHLPPDDGRLGALYNNLGLTYLALDRFDEAHGVYQKALGVMAKVPDGVLEMAITYLNDADVYEAAFNAAFPGDGDDPAMDAEWEKAAVTIRGLLEKAKACLEDPSPKRGGYYAFVCEKCAPIFTYFGWSDYGNDLKERADAIYAANRAD